MSNWKKEFDYGTRWPRNIALGVAGLSALLAAGEAIGGKGADIINTVGNNTITVFDAVFSKIPLLTDLVTDRQLLAQFPNKETAAGLLAITATSLLASAWMERLRRNSVRRPEHNETSGTR